MDDNKELSDLQDLKIRIKILSSNNDLLLQLIKHLKADRDPIQWLTQHINENKVKREEIEAHVTILEIQRNKPK